ncbi:MAG: pilus assembly protein, partial [Actinobacteria bacterium]|nr:pilus assembly protein [Actinomycetota bacterium]
MWEKLVKRIKKIYSLNNLNSLKYETKRLKGSLTTKKFLKRFLRKFLRKNAFYSFQNGQATLEFALVIPVVIMVILAVSQFGYIVYVENLIQQASREGARVISTTNSNEKAYHTIGILCSNLNKESLDTFVFPQSPSSRNVGDLVTVQLTYR